jgi:hypothetical protein
MQSEKRVVRPGFLTPSKPGGEHGWLMKGKTARLLPLLHTLVEERAGERRFPTHPPPFMSQPWAVKIGRPLGLKSYGKFGRVTV